MGYEFEDESLVLERNESNNCTEFILKHTHANDTVIKLSQVFKLLPNGRINKTETGIGATTLELNSPRHSIIVQPLRITAKEKANRSDVFYFGNIDLAGIRTKTITQKLIEYIKNPLFKYKKISVVSDSLPTLIKYLDEDVYEKYFLLIDEIDSVQKNSTYRSKMEICIEYYKKFNNRAMISATLLEFSDPELQEEKLTIIKYDYFKKHGMHIHHTNSPDRYAIELITKLKNNPKVNKLVVAYNEVAGCIELAEKLISEKLFTQDEISILCGAKKSNRDKTAKYGFNKIVDDIFPNTVNFTTSAYFSGFDINERYHLIVISNHSNAHTRLSEHEMIQIAGRCRVGLLSLNIIYSSFSSTYIFKSYLVDQLISAAETEINALKCIKTNYDGNLTLKSEAERMRKVLVKNTGVEGFNFVRINISDVDDISYLNIDAFIESKRVIKNYYLNNHSLKDYFDQLNYKVDQRNMYYPPPASSELKGSSQTKVKTALIKLQELKPKNHDDINKLIHESTSEEEKLTYEFYIKTIDHLSLKSILEYIEKASSLSKIKFLSLGFDYAQLDKKDALKLYMRANFKLKSTYSQQEKHDLFNAFFIKYGKTYHGVNYNITNLNKLLNSYVKFSPTTIGINEDRTTVYKVISHSPYEFEKHRIRSSKSKFNTQ